jgi:nicotinate phosphoribosyltransferase
VARSDESEELRPVAKRSVGKPGRGGRKWASRQRNASGEAVTERITLVPPELGPNDRLLLSELIHGGKIIGREPLADARTRHVIALAELPPYAQALSRGYPAIPTVFDSNGEAD